MHEKPWTPDHAAEKMKDNEGCPVYVVVKVPYLQLSIYLSMERPIYLSTYLHIDMHTCSWCSYLKDKMQVCIYTFTYIPTYLPTYIHTYIAYMQILYVCM